MDTLKAHLISPPVLQYFYVHKPVILFADASQHGLGAVCHQDSRPVAFASRALTKTEAHHAQIEKELLGLMLFHVHTPTTDSPDTIEDYDVLTLDGVLLSRNLEELKQKTRSDANCQRLMDIILNVWPGSFKEVPHDIQPFYSVMDELTVDDELILCDCLGSHFTWLQAIFTNFPALLNFVSKLKCVTGLCPKDFEDYGCTCRFEMEGLPIDATDSCCFQHRKCYEEALELDCTWDPAEFSTDVSCLSKNLTCEAGGSCERLLCSCDKAAIECFLNAHINVSMKGVDITSCPALVTVFPDTTGRKHMTAFESKIQQNRSVDTVHSPPEEGEQINLPNGVTTFPSAEEIITMDKATPHLVSTEAPVVMSTDNAIGANILKSGATTISNNDPGTSSASGKNPTLKESTSLTPEGITYKRSVTTAVHNTTRRTNLTLTSERTGFKMAEDSTVRSDVLPVTENDPEESVEKVCDRFTFHQVKANGEDTRELPLLGEMLFCLTGKCPEEFESHGCYCGQEGRGNPVDILDSCCFSHQCCIEHLKKLGCQPDRNIRSEVICLDHKPTCVGWSICDKLICSCDKAAAECMADAPFNSTARSVSRNQCQGETVLCRNGGAQEKPAGDSGSKSDSSSSEESSEEHRPMRDIVQAGDAIKPLPLERRPRSVSTRQ
ncbi:otoconin-90 [Bombina bombina]|uniref:otoconin-90 n=1 Tax=Bombina bombina TaxID=8345 RepID=UPI00235A583C|nr:otoconin-90 [Bombina bombina]